MSNDFTIETHKAWLGLLQPVGLVVSPVALAQAQAAVDSNCIESQLVLKQLLKLDGNQKTGHSPFSLEKLFVEVLGWRKEDLQSLSPGSEIGSLFLKEYQESLSATHAVFESKEAKTPLILIQQVSGSADLDTASEGDGWRASPQSKFERILREKAVPIGLLLNTQGVRLVYVPRGESSGYVTFPYSLMAEVQGRIVLGAFKMLLGAERLFTLAPKERLPNLLNESRKYQNTVSTMLSEQVLGALYELLRGLQGANDRTSGKLLEAVLHENPNLVYHGLLTILLRNVFMLYAEDRDLIPAHSIYAENYSIKGLFEKLRADESRFSDTMDLRFGAWAQLISIYRIIHEGIKFPGFTLPPRRGHLFDPNRFPFLEGRLTEEDPVTPPLISDGVVFRVLKNLMLLDGERISYRTLDVEQIGSVYETVMGFKLEIASGTSVAIKPKKAHGAPSVIDLDLLLSIKRTERAKWFKERTDQEITGSALSDAATTEDLEAVLERKISRIATPSVVSKGAMVLQPSDERRRSGSHYTPRSLTEPIVKKAMEPLIAQLGTDPKPDQILNLKVCDPAMGSGAFLVEATRQLSEALVKAWRIHQMNPKVPADEDELLYARRLIVHRCIYGVDKNPMAVDLAKLSLWLSTFAKDHSFTFLDHALKCGDSLVGLTLEQIARGSWLAEAEQNHLFTHKVREIVEEYIELRREVTFASTEQEYDALVILNEEAQQRSQRLRAAGDMVLNAFFSGSTDRERKEILSRTQATLLEILQMEFHHDRGPILPDGIRSFHWALEFPEVFHREDSGFDVYIGNPPFIAGKDISSKLSPKYLEWIKTRFEFSGGQTDLCAYFFVSSFNLLREKGCLGFVATNTIYQGDTRKNGLGVITSIGGSIYSAVRRLAWPGIANVVISIVHICKGDPKIQKTLNGNACDFINRFLVASAFNQEPNKLKVNAEMYSSGFYIYGQGFLFEDDNDDATPLAQLKAILERSPEYGQFVHPYIGGDDVLGSPVIPSTKQVIDFEWMEYHEVQKWPLFLDILEAKVRPGREAQGRERRKQFWWQFGERSPRLREIYKNNKEVLMIPFTASHLVCTLVPTDTYVASPHTVIQTRSFNEFCVLQSRIHEIWTRLFASSMKDDLRYAPSDCFETFPLPNGIDKNVDAVNSGRSYYEFRADLMIRNSEGLTKIYNRFHDPDEHSLDILKLREMHLAMDHAVLKAYGWGDIEPKCVFLLDYEEDEIEEPAGRQRKKPWRYRWPDTIRDEVMARLLDLNAMRADEESFAAPKEVKKKRKSK